MRNTAAITIRFGCLFIASIGVLFGQTAFAGETESASLKVLLLGDNGHHRPADRFAQLQPVMARRGIDMTYTDEPDALNPNTLATYDGLMIYANIRSITRQQEKALLEAGHVVVPKGRFGDG